MATQTQNVCRYYKFGHCKFADKCRFNHIHEKCGNSSCEIRSCKLRHPRICKFFRDYKRCKFGEWCSFDHDNNNNNEDTINTIMEKIQNLETVINEKDLMIQELAQKIKKLEEVNEESLNHSDK